MRAAETAYPVEKHMASVSLVFDDEQNAYLRELSETMNLDFGEFIPHVTLINVTEQDMPRLKAAAAALPVLDKLVLDGVNFLPDKAGNCVWVELRTQKTAWMVEARQQLLAALDGIHPRGWMSMASARTSRLVASRPVRLTTLIRALFQGNYRSSPSRVLLLATTACMARWSR